MKFFASIAAIIAVLATCGSAAVAANKTFVAGGGTDTGTCPASAPCATFSYAYSQTNPGGEIACQSSGGFGSLTIAKSITLNCLGTAAGPGLGANLNSGVIDVNTSATDRVVIRGIDIHTSGDPGMDFFGLGTLVLDQMKISASSANGGSALVFSPFGPGKLVITDSIFTNGGVSTGAGILVKPQQNGTAQVTLERVTASGNAFGVAVDGSNSTGGINMTISDSVMASNANDGIVATSSAGTAPIGLLLTNVKSTNNGYGIRSIGSNVTVRVDGSRIAGNGVGLSGGGALLSAGDNIVEANGTNGAFTGAVAFK